MIRSYGKMAELTVCSVVRGYHVYKDERDPSAGSTFETEIDNNNQHDG